MDSTVQNQPTTWQTLASVLAGGLGGYVDAQNNQPLAVIAPAPQTAYGFQGIGQQYPYAYSNGALAQAQAPNWLWLAAIGLIAFFIIRKD